MGMKKNLLKNIKSILIELNISFYEHIKIIKILEGYKFKIISKNNNIKNNETSNYIFSK